MTDNSRALDRYLSPLDVWGLALGCMVGWGVFAMPGNTFLPVAGPAGTAIAMVVGMVIMLVIGSNFSYLMGRSAITGGMYSYTKEAFGRDHAFLGAWFLCLSYLTIVFLNGTALFYVVRTLFDQRLHKGLYYTIAGNRIYYAETLVSVLVLAGVGFLFVTAKPLLQKLHTVLAVILFAGVLITGAACLPHAAAGGALRRKSGSRQSSAFHRCSGATPSFTENSTDRSGDAYDRIPSGTRHDGRGPSAERSVLRRPDAAGS